MLAARARLEWARSGRGVLARLGAGAIGLFNILLGLTLTVYSVSVAALYEERAHLDRQEHEHRRAHVGHIG